MSTLHRCRLCLKLCRNKIHVFKDDFPKMIEILTGVKVDPNDDFPKNSCIDCANNVKIAVRTKKQIIKSHKTLLEEFLMKCKERNEIDILELKITVSEKENATDTKNFLAEVSHSAQTDKNSKDNLISRQSKPFIESYRKPVSSGDDSLSLNSLPVILKKEELDPKLDLTQTEAINSQDLNNIPEKTEQSIQNYDCFEDSNVEIANNSSNPISDSESIPEKSKEETASNIVKAKKKILIKDSNEVFFIKKRDRLVSKQIKTSESVIRIKRKPKERIQLSRVTCNICKKEVKRYWLQKHMETHEYNPVTCEFCGLISKSPTALRHHVYYYHKSSADEYMCDQCGRSFRSKYRLNLHKKKEHGGTKDFECTTCGKMFFEKMHLKRHVDKTHKNIRPYVCDFCGKSFKSRNHIKIHERIHSKEAPYTCHMCGEGFKMKLTLRTHLKGVHNVQEVQKVFCNICKRGFASNVALKAHVNSRIHETEKCQYCSEIFTREYMINHLRDLHGVEEAIK